MKGGGGRPLSPRRGLGNGHGGLQGGSPAGAVLCAQHLGILLSPCPPRDAASGQGDGTWKDPILQGPFSCGHGGGHQELRGQKGPPDAGAAGAGGEQGDFGEPCAALRSTDRRDYSLSSLIPFYTSNVLLRPLLHQRYLSHRRCIKRALKSPSPGLLGRAGDAHCPGVGCSSPPGRPPRPPPPSARLPNGQDLGPDPRDQPVGLGEGWQQMRRIGVSPRQRARGRAGMRQRAAGAPWRKPPVSSSSSSSSPSPARFPFVCGYSRKLEPPRRKQHLFTLLGRAARKGRRRKRRPSAAPVGYFFIYPPALPGTVGPHGTGFSRSIPSAPSRRQGWRGARLVIQSIEGKKNPNLTTQVLFREKRRM